MDFGGNISQWLLTVIGFIVLVRTGWIVLLSSVRIPMLRASHLTVCLIEWRCQAVLRKLLFGFAMSMWIQLCGTKHVHETLDITGSAKLLSVTKGEYR